MKPTDAMIDAGVRALQEWCGSDPFDEVNAILTAALSLQFDTVAQWMMMRGYATGHGDTVEDMLAELEAQIRTARVA